MAIFKAPKITTIQRTTLLLGVSELVYDVDQNIFYGGDGVTVGGLPIGSNVGTSIQPQRIELTQQDIDNKYVTLNIAPLYPNTVSLTCENGIPQINGVDFIVTGNILSWDGLGLDNFLDNTDVLIVQY
jgi:hypothetical protein